jgi:hypothetical protein
MFAAMGLQFFKKDKKVTHVSVARPNYLDVVATPVSDGVRRIVEFVEATPNCTRRLILENLAGLEHVEPKEGEAPPPAPEQTEEQKQLISDLHWLIHQGHVLDFANGVIETAKKPKPKEEKKAKKEPKAEEPKADEPKADEPKADEPKADEPKADEPKADEPKADEPKAEEPKADEPKADEPKAEEPKAEEPKAVAEAPVDAEVVEENPKAPTDEVSVPEKQEEESKGE